MKASSTPFGMNLKGIEEEDLQSTLSDPEYAFQYNGKEKQEKFRLLWNDHGARSLDLLSCPEIGLHKKCRYV